MGITALLFSAAVAIALGGPGCGANDSDDSAREIAAVVSDALSITDEIAAASNANQVGLEEVAFVGTTSADDIDAAQQLLVRLDTADEEVALDTESALNALNEAARGLREVAAVVGGLRDAAADRSASRIRVALASIDRGDDAAATVQEALHSAVANLRRAVAHLEASIGESGGAAKRQMDTLNRKLMQLESRGDSSAAVLVAAVDEEAIAARRFSQELSAAQDEAAEVKSEAVSTPEEEVLEDAAFQGVHCGDLAAICIVTVKISADGEWAAVFRGPKPGHHSEVQPDMSSFHKIEGYWQAFQIGNGGGCDVPQTVADELGLGCF